MRIFFFPGNLVFSWHSVCLAGLAVAEGQLWSMCHNFPSTKLKNNTSLHLFLSFHPPLLGSFSSSPPPARGRVIKTSSSLFEGRGRKAVATWWSIRQSLLCGSGWRWITTTDKAMKQKPNSDLTSQFFMLSCCVLTGCDKNTFSLFIYFYIFFIL